MSEFPTVGDDFTKDLSPSQSRALVALLSSSTVGGAAKVVQVDPSTLWRWMREDEAFRAAYRAFRRQSLEVASARLQHATGTAVDTLVAIAKDKRQTGAARVAACRVILDTAFRAAELDDVAARLDALESKVNP